MVRLRYKRSPNGTQASQFIEGEIQISSVSEEDNFIEKATAIIESRKGGKVMEVWRPLNSEEMVKRGGWSQEMVDHIGMINSWFDLEHISE